MHRAVGRHRPRPGPEEPFLEDHEVRQFFDDQDAARGEPRPPPPVRLVMTVAGPRPAAEVEEEQARRTREVLAAGRAEGT